ncbi:molybdate ABC transporter substrate-binding protein [Patulibacter sp.]|uniref:molybdate ABC transporter substrate-binding protein n=1 Tax=Patulibacter sp. TaxID=1912859 RepID=UPI00271A3A9F|nr:molybdate ABC transporter substrate-binding protein [Patulibacter sp.]MDO9408734.1 molybdate ABC transporter substrate-binding protein [Patulibacter sp.]
MPTSSPSSAFVPRYARRTATVALALATALGVTACGSDDESDGAGSGSAGGDRPTLTVQAAASLTGALTACTKDYGPAKVRLSFAGSDELAAQIRKGAGGDLFAAANATLPQELAQEGKVDTPVAFAGNELVLAVPATGAKVDSLEAIADGDDVRLAVGAPSVPVGSYTQKALGRLPQAQRKAILDRVRTEEPDVKSVLAKLQQGVVDAAFVYRTDVTATKGAVKAVALPTAIRPKVSYEAAVVTGSEQAAAAKALLEDLRSGTCGAALRTAGFLAPGAAG